VAKSPIRSAATGAARTPGTVATKAGKARRCLYGLLAILAAALVTLKVIDWSRSPRPDPPPPEDSFPLVPISTSPFLNTRPEVAYVGSDACRACHASHDLSFRRTGMGRSMAEVDPAQEPVDGAFNHAPSKRRYEIRRRPGQLWHRELLRNEGTEEVLLSEFPLKYVVGSGRHSRTYVVEIDGFLTESPATWYAAGKTWDLSPGYEGADQPGFARPVEENCLFCHAGRVEALERSLHKLRVVEAAISCERCHGPGALHVARHRADSAAALDDAVDHTIVNPAHLPRDLQEAVCQQCHLQSSSMSLARGRTLTAYRPGLPLQDFKHDYQLDVPAGSMTVVGHVEQLHLSRCYQASAQLTCLTCHDPHARTPRQGIALADGSSCLKCHATERCKVDKARQTRESPDNNCIQCHMPRSETDIAHLAFTHHRIGIHAKKPDQERTPAGPAALKPVLDLGRLGAVERARSLGLANLEMADKQRTPQLAAPYLTRTIDALTAVSDQGLRDPELLAALDLARFLLARTAPANESLLNHADLSPSSRCGVLFAHAYAHVQNGAPEAALPYLRELTRLRRHATDWLLLAGSLQATGAGAAAIAALEQSVRINPRLWQAHRQLAEHYDQRGEKQRAAWHQRRAVP